jgi:hypothetical protein
MKPDLGTWFKVYRRDRNLNILPTTTPFTHRQYWDRMDGGCCR